MAPEANKYMLAFMTPYIRADKREAYREVAQCVVDAEHLSDSYTIPHYFLVEVKFK